MSIRKARTHFFNKKLHDFFRKAGREHLPWRRKNISAYEVWVSEIMLQQTQVSRVIGYYEKFVRRFPTVEKLARATWEEFLPYYQGLGYYARGRNMLKTAKMIVAQYQGHFPKEIRELEQLPGIGPYTARAIASFAYQAPHLAWDTNVRRVLGRFFFGGKNEITPECREQLGRHFAREAPILNAALMDFGSSLCLARPKCAACPLRPFCRYYRERGKREKRRESVTRIARKKVANQIDRVALFLHQNHQKYFSSAKKSFRPFLLPPGVISRHAIQAYFRDRYSLDLAVRPPHGNVEISRKKALAINAQILFGQPAFAIFPKSAVIRYTESISKTKQRL